MSNDLYCTDIRDIVKDYHARNKTITAILVDQKQWESLINDIGSPSVFPTHGGHIMYMYGVAIILKSQVLDKGDMK